jgi:hypothetical protein
MPSTGLTSHPDLYAFVDCQFDVWTNNNPPNMPACSARISGVNAKITGSYSEASRSRVNSTASFTHILVCDPSIAIQDSYVTNNTNISQKDYLAIPAGQTMTWWSVIICCIVNFPGIGKHKMILADRHNFSNVQNYTS